MSRARLIVWSFVYFAAVAVWFALEVMGAPDTRPAFACMVGAGGCALWSLIEDLKA